MDPTLINSLCVSARHICLLTHTTEVDHPTNTAVYALKVAAHYQLPLQRIIWHRLDHVVNSQLFHPAHWCLMFPAAQATAFRARLDGKLVETTPVLLPRPNIVILDATWQRAQKMFKQSPYLQQLPAVTLKAEHPSHFIRRRNQKTGAWCTAEVIQWLWQNEGEFAAAAQLAALFQQFNQGL